jgi:hypothetical protein
MRFILTPQAWILADLEPIEWDFLERLPHLASGEDFSADCRRRLLPDPIDVPAGQRGEYEGFLEDWAEYVQPDLEGAFASSRDRVGRDLDFARARLEEMLRDAEVPDEVPGYPTVVAIARESADHWYSALNQARLLMNEAHDLADAVERVRGPGGSFQKSRKPDAAKLLLLAQYEFYTALQSILIETIMRAGLDVEADEDGDGEEE